jgi:PAS domain S-box-containing protein
MKKLILYCFLSFVQILCFSQNTRIDSLQIIIGSKTFDAAYLKALYGLSCEYINSQDYERALTLSNEALILSTELNENYYEALSYTNLGIINDFSTNFYIALSNFNAALIIFDDLEKTGDFIDCLTQIGGVQISLGNYSDALEYNFRALKLAEEENDKLRIAKNNKNIGMIYDLKQQYDKALEYFFLSLKLFEQLDEKIELAKTLINISICYNNLKKYEESGDYSNQALAILKTHDYPLLKAYCFRQLGTISKEQKKYKQALDFFFDAYSIFKKTHYKLGIIQSLHSIGQIYLHANDTSSATEYFIRSFELARQLKLNNEIKDAANDLAEIYIASDNFRKAYEYRTIYSEIIEIIYNEGTTRQSAEIAAKYENEKVKQKLHEYQVFKQIILISAIVLVIILSTLLFAYRLKAKSNKLLMIRKEEIEKKNAELELRKIEIDKQTERLKASNQELERLSFIAEKTNNSVVIISTDGKIEWVNPGFTRLFGYTIEEIYKIDSELIFKNLRFNYPKAVKQCLKERKTLLYTAQNKTRDGKQIWLQTTLTPIFNDNNEIVRIIAIDSDISTLKQAEVEIEMQKEEISTQRDELIAQKDVALKQRNRIVQQNMDITDSIYYASRILAAIQTTESTLNEIFTEHFVINKPKYIVSGDFFWVADKLDKIVIVVGDCAGYGVPGAMMSMLGITYLNEIINSINEVEADEILNILKTKLIKSLQYDGKAKAAKDRMDLTLCVLDKKNHELQFCSANTPIYLLKSTEFIELQPDKRSGFHTKIGISVVNQKIQLNKGETFYIFTNGIIDQFKRDDSKEDFSDQFKQLLIDIQNDSMNMQKNIIVETLINWIGLEEQIDDILLMGIRI